MLIFRLCQLSLPPRKGISEILLRPTKLWRQNGFCSIIWLQHVFSSTNVLSKDPAKHKYKGKKDVSGPYPLAYYPQEVEKYWYEYWEQNKFFQPEFHDGNTTDGKPHFSMVLPPPNITGNLHLGHTFTAAIQDSICRWRRMNGESVVWIPGYDHGGIATQTVVEKKLFKEKKINRHQLGKEAFLYEVMAWKSKTYKNIEQQLRKLGCSLDFTRSSFTMDLHTSEAVVKTFIQLFEENLIYRKEKMVNWSCALQSVISDIEVDHLEVPGNSKLRVPGLADPVDVGILEFFYYPLCDSENKLLVATTRLETMLGDVALAVNPNDSRYTEFIGKYVRHPFTGKQLPIIADASVNKDFGTGVMKVTPAHDFKDFELSTKHQLPLHDIFSDEGTVKSHIKTFGGKHRFEVRALVRDHLIECKLYLEKRSHPMSIPVCSRTGDVVEPRMKWQWYLDCSAMAQKAVEVVKEKKLILNPEFYEKVWFEWFRNSQDWCISRQLWWGHQIPVYRISHSFSQISDVWIAAKNQDEATEKAAKRLNVSPSSISAIQDEDVLDTWFSSSLFPLTALGWPTKLGDFNKFYPLSLMETGFDILFFWVSRMVMLGQHLTGKLPFSQVLLHGMICDSHGRKMTKSLGNIVDPSDIIEGTSVEKLCERAENSFKQGSLSPEELKLALNSYRRSFPTGIPECGTDALRFSLLSYDVKSQRINLDIKSIRISRHFCNKIWQGVRLFTKAIENCDFKANLVPFSPQDLKLSDMSEVDQWILSRLSRMVSHANQGFETHDFHFATYTMRQFWVQNFCDIYLEYVKPLLTSGDDNVRLFSYRVMLTCIEIFLRTIAPIMPFLSEELYQRLCVMTNLDPLVSVMISHYPSTNEYSVWRNTVLEADIQTAMDLVSVARSLKTQHGASKMRPKVTIAVDCEETLAALNRFGAFIATLAKLDSVVFHVTQGQEFFEHHVQDTWVFREHEHGISVIMEMDQKPDSGKSSENKVDDIREELNKLSKMVSDSGYRKKAPLSVQEKHLAKKASLEAELQKCLTQYGKTEDSKTDSSVSENRS